MIENISKHNIINSIAPQIPYARTTQMEKEAVKNKLDQLLENRRRKQTIAETIAMITRDCT